MPHRETQRKYAKRVNSNGEDVSPTICSTICKGVQRQLDNSGAYVLDYIRKHLVDSSDPLTHKKEV